VGPELDPLRALVRTIGLEALCDALAFEWLIPGEHAAKLAAEPPDLDGLAVLAHAYRVSFAVFVNQVNRHNANLVLIRFSRTTTGDWVVSDCTGAPAPWRLGMTLAQKSARDLDGLPITRGDCARMTISTEDASGTLSADVARYAHTAVALARRSDHRVSQWDTAGAGESKVPVGDAAPWQAAS
jgi:hypothetical protein